MIAAAGGQVFKGRSKNYAMCMEPNCGAYAMNMTSHLKQVHKIIPTQGSANCMFL